MPETTKKDSEFLQTVNFPVITFNMPCSIKTPEIAGYVFRHLKQISSYFGHSTLSKLVDDFSIPLCGRFSEDAIFNCNGGYM